MSTSGYSTFVGGNIVKWKSKKQNVITRSSAEAEFRSMALGLLRDIMDKTLLIGFGLPIRSTNPIVI